MIRVVLHAPVVAPSRRYHAMASQPGYEYMQLVFNFGSFVPEGKKDAIGYWEVMAVGPDGSQEQLATRVDGTHIRSWWWGAPLREISQYLTQYGNDGWSLIAENVGDGNDGSWERYRYVLSRPDASSHSSIPERGSYI